MQFSVLKRTLTVFLAAALMLSLFTVCDVAADEKPALDINFEQFEVGDKPLLYGSGEIVQYGGSNALKLALDKVGKSAKFNSVIVGECCIAFDIAAGEGDISGKLSVLGGGTPVTLLNFGADGAITTYNNKPITRCGKDFKRVVIVYNTQRDRFTVYVDKKTIVSDFYVPTAFDKCVDFTFELAAVNEDVPVYLDNVLAYSTGIKTSKCFVYNPENTLDTSHKIKLTGKTYFPKETQRDLLQGKTAIHMRSGVVYADEIKYQLKKMPYMKNDEFMVPVEAVEKCLGAKVEVSADKITVSGDIELKQGEKQISVRGVREEIATAPEFVDDEIYLPLSAIAKQGMGKSVYYDNTAISGGMVIISDTAFKAPEDEAQLKALNDFLFYFRPTPEKITEDYKSMPTHGVHPRIMCTESDFERIRGECETNEIKKNWKKNLLIYCDTILAQPTLFYELRDGVRLMYVADDFENYMLSLGMAYQLTGDKKYVQCAWKHIEAVSAFPDWNPSHHMDVGIMAVGMSVAYDWMYDCWSPSQRKTMEAAVYNNLFWISNLTYEGDKRTMGGTNNDQNHNVVCNGGILMCSMAFFDIYPQIAAQLTSNAVRALEYMIYNFAPYGAWFEGPSYAGLTLDYVTRMFSTMESTLGSLYSMDKVEGVDKAADYLSYVQSDISGFNFGPAEMGRSSSAGLFWLYGHYHTLGCKDTLAKNRYAKTVNDSVVHCLQWYDVTEESATSQRTLDYYDGSEVITMRNTFDDGQVFAGVKGGKMTDGFLHLDAGSFVFDAMGVRWAYDLGKDDYNLYYDYYRYDIFRLRPESHNTILINPDKDPGFVFDETASITSYVSKPRGTIVKLDMSRVLSEDVSAAQRGFFFTDDRRSLVVRDEIVVPEKSDIYWLMYISADAQVDGNTVVLTDKANKDKKVKLDFVSNRGGELYVEAATPFPDSPVVEEQMKNSGYKRIVYKVNAKGNVDITAKIIPLDFSGSDIKEYNVPIDSWQIPDGELVDIPKPDSIEINGESMDVNSRYIDYEVETDESPVPEIKAESSKYQIEITTPDTIEGSAYITLSDTENTNNRITYTVKFEPKIRKQVFDGYENAKVINVTVSAQPQPENIASNVIDGKAETRWSAENTQWLLLELDKPQKVDSIFMSMYVGDQRKTFFDIMVSSDGEKFESVYSGGSSGTTNDYESYEVGREDVKFIKINFFGNSTGSWNSVTEVAPVRKK